MMRKNIKKWIVLLSIISVALLITPTMGATLETGTFEEPGEGEDQTPIDNYIWLVVDGDDITEQDQNPSPSTLPSGDGIPLGRQIADSGDMLGSDTLQSPEEVDEVFIASDYGVVDRELFIGTDLPLTILGQVKINVLDGSENLNGNPYFDGYDVLDKGALAITVAAYIFIASAIKALNYIFKAAQCVLIATTLMTKVFNAVLDYLVTGIFELTIGLKIGGIDISWTMKGKLLELIHPFVEVILNSIESLCDMGSEIIDIIEDIRDSFQDVEVENMLLAFINNDIPMFAGVIAIGLRLRGKSYNEIESLLTLIMRSTKAKIIRNTLEANENAFTKMRINTLGQLDVFISGGAIGDEAIKLRNLHAEIKSNYQAVEGKYAAVIQIEAISAGKVFDTKKIGIIYDGSANDIPGGQEAMNQNQDVLPGETMGTITPSELPLSGGAAPSGLR